LNVVAPSRATTATSPRSAAFASGRVEITDDCCARASCGSTAHHEAATQSSATDARTDFTIGLVAKRTALFMLATTLRRLAPWLPRDPSGFEIFPRGYHVRP
jgi:hypothetical protein